MPVNCGPVVVEEYLGVWQGRERTKEEVLAIIEMGWGDEITYYPPPRQPAVIRPASGPPGVKPNTITRRKFPLL